MAKIPETTRLVAARSGRHEVHPLQLRRASQDRNVRLREIAQRVLETGLDPADA